MGSKFLLFTNKIGTISVLSNAPNLKLWWFSLTLLFIIQIVECNPTLKIMSFTFVFGKCMLAFYCPFTFF